MAGVRSHPLQSLARDERGAIRVRRIGTDDLRYALARGIDDFKALPSHLVMLGLIYPIMGLILGRAAIGSDLLPLIFPLVAGFALVGPFAAIGLYEISRRREQGLDAAWWHVFDVLRSPSRGAIALLGLLMMALFLAWLGVAMAIYRGSFGEAMPTSVMGFATDLFTTRAGWGLILFGNAVGFLFAVAALSISVVSFPLLLDRNVDAMTAMRVSLAAVARNPGPMALWGLIVAAALALGSLPLFVGLAVVMPVLGHATWHLYRAVVER